MVMTATRPIIQPIIRPLYEIPCDLCPCEKADGSRCPVYSSCYIEIGEEEEGQQLQIGATDD